MKIVKPLIAITAAGAVLYTAGCAPVKIQNFEKAVAESFEMMQNPEAKKVQADAAGNPVAAAENLLIDTVVFYKGNVASDGVINSEGDSAELSDLMRRAAALKINPAVKGMKNDSYTRQCLDAVEKIASKLAENYQSGVDDNVLFIVAVDALGEGIGKQNYGWRNPRGGYVVKGSIEDAKYAIWASLCTENSGSGREYPIEKKIERLKTDKKYAGDHKAQEAQADAIVKQIQEKAVTSDPRPLTSTEARNKYGTHLSGRQAVALISALSNPADRDWQTQGIQKLFSDAPGDDRKMVGQEEGIGVIAIVTGAELKKSYREELDKMVEAAGKYVQRQKK
ncbi:hypothetical protein JW707_04185 [Candidatus Woesearchaeota archaeon]|nr:hypothetical protein [Candidatus Woesearchaeota archaeon]